MPRNVYSEINLHITWHTKSSRAVLTDSVEHQLHRFLRARIAKTSGAFFHAIGGTADHIHLAVTIPPTIPISDWIGELKGSSAHHINHEICNRKVLQWQTGYGVVSFGTKDLHWVIDYIRNQKEHHAKGTTHDRLERIEIENPVEAGCPAVSLPGLLSARLCSRLRALRRLQTRPRAGTPLVRPAMNRFSPFVIRELPRSECDAFAAMSRNRCRTHAGCPGSKDSRNDWIKFWGAGHRPADPGPGAVPVAQSGWFGSVIVVRAVARADLRHFASRAVVRSSPRRPARTPDATTAPLLSRFGSDIHT